MPTPLHTSSPVKRLLAGFALAVVLLAACGGGSSHNAQDVTFAKDMIPHHEQAVEMSDMAATNAGDEKVQALAASIKGAQAPEIAKMQGWLSDWGESSDMAGMDHSSGDMSGMAGMGGMGMMSDADMEALGSASGTDFDRMFLTMMTAHHNGAIEMAKTELAKGKFQPAKDLAKAIQDTQAKEIAEMQQLLSALPAA